MKKEIVEGMMAPDFTLLDTQGKEVCLSQFRGEKYIILVLNRGFACPHCRHHMEQLRQDYLEFSRRGAEIIVLGPDGPNAFRRYWHENDMPFVGLSDIRSKVADTYYQEVNLLKLGRMPALFVIDKKGVIRYVQYGKSMSDNPPNEEVLSVLDEIDQMK